MNCKFVQQQLDITAKHVLTKLSIPIFFPSLICLLIVQMLQQLLKYWNPLVFLLSNCCNMFTAQ